MLLVLVAALTLEATALLQYFYSRDGIRGEAKARAESELKATQNRIMDVVDQTEAAVRNSMLIAQWCLLMPDNLQMVAQRIVEDNPVVVGSTVALVPGYLRRRPLYAPYVFKGKDTLEFKTLATTEYDYPSKEWFIKPIETGQGYWSEPYIDHGGGDILMVTYSMPLKDKDGRVAAVITADISLDWLTELVGNIKVYPNAFSMVVSHEGRILVCPAESLVMKSTIHEVVRTMDDTIALSALNRAMLAGESGSLRVKEKGVSSEVFFSPVERTGWSLSIVIPDNEIYSGIKRIGLMVTVLQIVGLLLIVLLLYLVITNMLRNQKLSSQKERIEGELKIASDIQMSMVPKIFPPFPERKDIDMSATIVPAKEVGGDLYDFYIRDEKLFFCVGDVSGKGIPASLVMAVTRSLFRTLSAHEASPQRILTSMNNSMSETNESNMFVTFFCGVLDMKTGHMRYCNAGHNAPVMLTDHISFLPVEPNLPLGVMPGAHFREQEIDFKYDDAIFLYTDGLTEAENAQHELFGEERMKAALHGRRSADEHMENMKAKVAGFVGDAPQSDDLTLLFIHYLNEKAPERRERHLILHNDIQQIPQLAEFIEKISEEKHLEQSLAMSLNLALEEAVTNVILYAYPEGSDGLVDVEALVRDKELEFIISDSGTPFDPTAAPEADITLGVDERKIGGLGIFLVRNIMDSVSYERKDGKNILSMHKNI